MKLGFLGTGNITSDVISGICKSSLKFKQIVFSRRNRIKANKLRTSSGKSLNSLNYYYGYYVALYAMLPSILLLLAISIFDKFYIEFYILSDFSEDLISSEKELLFTQIVNTAQGIKLFDTADILIDRAAEKYLYIKDVIRNLTYTSVIAFSSILLFFAYRKVNSELDSRSIVETFLLVLFFSHAWRIHLFTSHYHHKNFRVKTTI